MAYLANLDENSPDGDTDTVAGFDTELQDLKTDIQSTFPNVTGAVTANIVDLYQVVTATSAIQTQLNAHAANLTDYDNLPYLITGSVNSDATQLRTSSAIGINWGVAHITTGQYNVVHNLSTSNYATILIPDWTHGSAGVVTTAAVGQSPNSFIVSTYDGHAGTSIDVGFIFFVVIQ